MRKEISYPGSEEEMKVSADDISINFILDERARELAGEQLRWFDLKPIGTLVERVRECNPEAAPNVKAYHVLRPIPHTEINFTQNEGDQ